MCGSELGALSWRVLGPAVRGKRPRHPPRAWLSLTRCAGHRPAGAQLRPRAPDWRCLSACHSQSLLPFLLGEFCIRGLGTPHLAPASLGGHPRPLRQVLTALDVGKVALPGNTQCYAKFPMPFTLTFKLCTVSLQNTVRSSSPAYDIHMHTHTHAHTG